MNFSNFDNEINIDDINKFIEEFESNNTNELPNGEYLVTFEKLELGATQDGRPMLRVCARILEAINNDESYSKNNYDALKYLSHYGQKKPCMFMNKVIYGTKNDARMIASVVGWLKKLKSNFEIEFNSYSDFERLIYDVFSDIQNRIEYHVEYNTSAFNTINIKCAYEV